MPAGFVARTLLPGRTMRSVYGPRLVKRGGDFTFFYCVAGAYGTFLSDIVAAYPKPFTFLDIGANIGLFSLLAARNPHCAGLYAFEPIPESFRLLVQNLKENRCRSAVPICAGILESERRFAPMRYLSMHSGSSRFEPPGHGSVTAMVIGSGDLDDLLADRPEQNVFAKIDVEGAELSVLSVLRKCTVFPALSDIVVEVSDLHAGAGQAEAISSAMTADGFMLVARSAPGPHYDAHFRRRP